MCIRDSISIDEIADIAGSSTNYLYRMGIEGESGVNFPLSKLTPIMKATENYIILKTLNRLNGFICIKEPYGALSKKKRKDLIWDFQVSSSQIGKKLNDFLQEPSEALKRSWSAC